ADDPALPVRPRPQLHGVPDRRSDRRTGHRRDGRVGDGHGPRTQRRRPRRRRGRAGVPPRRRGEPHPPGLGAEGVRPGGGADRPVRVPRPGPGLRRGTRRVRDLRGEIRRRPPVGREVHDGGWGRSAGGSVRRTGHDPLDRRRGGLNVDFFTEVEGPIPYGGPDADSDLAFRVYQPDRLVLGKRMEDHLRFAVCYWHSFSWAGNDIFGFGTFDRPWIEDASDPLQAAERKLDAAFEFFQKLGVPFFCFHDVDIAPYTD